MLLNAEKNHPCRHYNRGCSRATSDYTRSTGAAQLITKIPIIISKTSQNQIKNVLCFSFLFSLVIFFVNFVCFYYTCYVVLLLLLLLF